ncbi:hypothetical protein Q9233_013246 [Columba guinea]|nr:hypothetical protein Q9233_013246 [Columba guinea]
MLLSEFARRISSGWLASNSLNRRPGGEEKKCAVALNLDCRRMGFELEFAVGVCVWSVRAELQGPALGAEEPPVRLSGWAMGARDGRKRQMCYRLWKREAFEKPQKVSCLFTVFWKWSMMWYFVVLHDDLAAIAPLIPEFPGGFVVLPQDRKLEKELALDEKNFLKLGIFLEL